jgi:lysine 2,3-aminomutase
MGEMSSGESTPALTTLEELAAAGLIRAGRVRQLKPVSDRYAVAVTPAIAQLIDRGDPDDPIARQFLPSEAELESGATQLGDPIGDERHTPVKGVVHRYRDRALLKLTLVCPVYCRFCFRREMVGPGAGQILTPGEIDAALSYIQNHPEIGEVILTGGDPLMLSPRRLAGTTRRLESMRHITVLRWHSRVPVADSPRVSTEMVQAIKSCKATWLVLHVNHPRELTADAITAAARFIDAGIPVLSQSVLLKGVNDNIETMQQLVRALVAARIKPYYLHHMDLAPGTSHFRTTIAEGQALVAELRRSVSGLAVPNYVLDIPGGYAKAQLAASDLAGDAFPVRLKDGEGVWHHYSEF